MPERDDRSRNHYDVLGVDPAADEATLRQAYVALARRHHPDVTGGDAAQMRTINAAWAVLGDPVRRARYDLGRDAPPSSPRAPASAWDPAEVDLESLDDAPIGVPVRLPRWLSLLPAGLFALSVAMAVLGVVLAAEPILALALVSFVLSCMFFLAAPFVALFASRRLASGGPPESRR